MNIAQYTDAARVGYERSPWPGGAFGARAHHDTPLLSLRPSGNLEQHVSTSSSSSPSSPSSSSYCSSSSSIARGAVTRAPFFSEPAVAPFFCESAVAPFFCEPAVAPRLKRKRTSSSRSAAHGNDIDAASAASAAEADDDFSLASSVSAASARLDDFSLASSVSAASTRLDSEGERTVTAAQPSTRRERWTETEHAAFLAGLCKHGRKWKTIKALIPTKTATQVRTHANGYFSKILRQHAVKPEMLRIAHLLASMKQTTPNWTVTKV